MQRTGELTIQELHWQDDRSLIFDENNSNGRGNHDRLPSDISMEALQNALDEEVEALRHDKYFYQNCFKQSQRELEELRNSQDTDLHDVRKQNVESRIEIELLQKRVQSLKIELQKSESKYAQTCSQLESLQEINAGLEQNLGGNTDLFYDSKLQMEAAIRTIMDEKVQLSNALRKVDSEYSQVKQEKAILASTIATLESELSESKDEIKKMKVKANSTHTESATHSSRLLSLEKELSRVTDERNKYNKLYSDIQSQLLDLESQSSSQRIKYSHLEREKLHFETENQILCDKFAYMESNAGIAVAEAIRLKSELDTMQSQGLTWHQENLDLRQSHEDEIAKSNELTLIKTQLEIQCEEQQEKIREYEIQINSLTENVQFLENEMTAELEVKNALISEKSLLQSTVETLESLLESDNEALSSVVAEKARILQKNQTCVADLTSEREKNISLTAELIKCKERLSALGLELSAKEACIDSLTTELERASDNMKQAEPNHEAMQRELESLKALYQQQTVDLELMQSSKDVLEIDCVRLREANDALNDINVSMRNASDRTQDELIAQKNESMILQKSLNTALETIAGLNERQSQQFDEIARLKGSLDEATAELIATKASANAAVNAAVALVKTNSVVTTNSNSTTMRSSSTTEPTSKHSKFQASENNVEDDFGEPFESASLVGDDHVNELQLLVDDEIDRLEVANAMLRSQLERKSYELNDALNRLQQTMDEKTGLIERSQTMTEVLYSMQSSKIQVDIDLVDAMSRIKEFENDCRAYQIEIARLQDERDDLEGLNSKLLNDICVLEEDAVTMRETQLASDQESLNKLHILEDDFNKLKISEEDLFDDRNKVKKEKAALMKSFVALQKEKHDLTEEMKKKEISYSENMVQLKQKHTTEFETARSSWEETETAYKDRIDSCETTIQSLRETVENLDQLHNESESKNEELRLEISNLNESIVLSDASNADEIASLKEALRLAESNHKTTIATLMETLGLSDANIGRIMGDMRTFSSSELTTTSRDVDHSGSVRTSTRNGNSLRNNTSTGTANRDMKLAYNQGLNSKTSKLWQYSLLKEIMKQMEIFQKAQVSERDMQETAEWESQVLAEAAVISSRSKVSANDNDADRLMISSFADLYQRRKVLTEEMEYLSMQVQHLVTDTKAILSDIRVEYDTKRELATESQHKRNNSNSNQRVRKIGGHRDDIRDQYSRK